MTDGLRQERRDRPLVALVGSVPLLAEALRAALDFADLQSFDAKGGEIGGLLSWLRPDAVVVDGEKEATDAAAYALAHPLPVLHISLGERALRLFIGDHWREIPAGEAGEPETVRNVLAGALFAPAGVPR